jgi:aryl-alcohol dehydrogenase-like predicted oxidoreductase
VRKAVEASLRRLGTDWIDLYQIREPDPLTPIAETLHALDELVAEGKIRYAGSSRFDAWQVTDADWTARTTGTERFISAQNKYSLYDRSAEAEPVPACVHLGIGILPYFPLEFGLLTGKYRRGHEAPAGSRLAAQTSRLRSADFDRIEALERFAADRGLTPLQVAIGGLAAQPTVGSVIAGATRPEQVAQNAAAGMWQPTADDLAALATVSGR